MIEKINVNEVTLLDLKIEKDNIYIITPGKVGTSNFTETIFEKHNPDRHIHNIYHLESLLLDNKKYLIISGIRNPLDMNVSYFIDTLFSEWNGPQLKQNNYSTIHNIYFHNRYSFENIKLSEILEQFFKFDFHDKLCKVFYEEYFKITNINSIDFDKEKGIQLYKLNENKYILFYVLEKINNNIEIIEKFFNLKFKNYMNESHKIPKEKYIEFKTNLHLNLEYKKNLLETDIMKYFYTEKYIADFYNKYNCN